MSEKFNLFDRNLDVFYNFIEGKMKATITDFRSLILKAIETGDIVFVTKRGATVGVFIPMKKDLRERYPELYREIKAVEFAEQMQEEGISPDEMIAVLRRRFKKNNGSDKES